MLKSLLLALAWGFALSPLAAQNYNFTEISNLPYTDQLSNIWGYVHTDGTEYALVGTENGASIVSLADPAAPVEVAFVTGAHSIWRELRVWGTRAYVVSDNTTDGLLVIDLSQLPTVTHQFLNPTFTVNGSTEVLQSIHTIHIDENGFGYLMGSNINNGETILIDVASNPSNPIFLGATNPVYAHDAYERNDTLYTSNIYAGTFSVYDISNRAAPVLLATKNTPFNFTHNSWLSDDSKTLFTTDEKANAYIASYDISDLNNITELDRFRRFESEGTSVIPHNAHVKNDYVFTSYYTEGVIVLDGSRPNNLVEVAHFDSYTDSLVGFHGDWGVYPYLPSGLILLSDMQTGLHVLQPNLQRACWLEGLVTELGTGTLLSGVAITLETTPIYTSSELTGDYSTGTAISGVYNVHFSKPAYLPKTVQVTLVNGQVTIENVELEPATPFNYLGHVQEFGTGAPIANAVIQLESPLYNVMATTDASGNFSVLNMYGDLYKTVVGAWGYHSQDVGTQSIQAGTIAPTYILEKGYRDEFALDLGWTVTAAASTGNWERGATQTPVRNGFGVDIVPAADMTNDVGNQCYVTGNNDGGVYAVDDVDNGSTTLHSPIFDLSAYTNPYLNFNYWWVNEGGSGAPNDTLTVSLSNGATSVFLAKYTASNYAWSAPSSFRIADFLTPTATMSVHFQTGDDPATGGHVVEAGIDDFEITEGFGLPVTAVSSAAAMFQLYPNPFDHQFQIEYQLPDALFTSATMLRVFDSIGKLVYQQTISTSNGSLSVPADWQSGIYWVELAGQTYPIIKK